MWIKTDEPGIYRHETTAGKWRVLATATDPDTGKVSRKEKWLTDATMSDAIIMREQLKTQIRQPTQVSGTVPTRSITHFAASWAAEMVESGRWRKSTAENNVRDLRQHILPRIGHIDVDALEREDIRRWITAIESAKYDRSRKDGVVEMVPYAHSSLRRWWKILRHLVKALYLESHVDRRLVEWCREIQGPTAPEVPIRRERETLTLDELRAVVEAARRITPTRYPEIVTLAHTGMRAGELYGLDWQHIDHDAGCIRIEQAYSSGVLGPVKTGRSRVAPLLPSIEEALQEQRERLFRTQNLGLRDDIVFPSDVGTRRYSSSLNNPLRKLEDACELDLRLGAQVFRRSFNTILRNAGVRGSIIMSVMGHESREMHDEYTNAQVSDQTVAILPIFEEAN